MRGEPRSSSSGRSGGRSPCSLHRSCAGIIVAYEPVWAIGENGRPATVAQTAPVMAAIAAELDAASAGTGALALLYGGSVGPENADGLLADPHTDGLFVGRAAWTAAGLLEIVAIAAQHEARSHGL